MLYYLIVSKYVSIIIKLFICNNVNIYDLVYINVLYEWGNFFLDKVNLSIEEI